MQSDPWAIIRKHKYSLSIISVGFVVFFNMLFNAPVWDDLIYIFGNAELQDINIIHFFDLNAINSTYYRPIPALYNSILLALFHQQTFFFHATQLTLHISSTILLMLFLRKFFSKPLAFCLSLLFLIHPMQVESVSYISGSANELFFLFGIIALLVGTKKTLSKSSIFLVTLLLLASLITKESSIIFFPALLGYTLLFQKKQIKPILLSEVVSVGIYVVLRFSTISELIVELPAIPIWQTTLIQRLQTMPAIFFYYLKTFFYPAILSVDQQWVVPSISLNNFYLPLFFSLLFLFAIAYFGYLIWRGDNRKTFYSYLFFALWYFIGIGMYMQIVPLDLTVTDRWFYVPMIGLLGMLGIFYVEAEKKNKIFARTFIGIFVIILCVFSIRTVIRNANWADEKTLYSHDVKLTKSFSLENNYANILSSEKKYDEALYYTKDSIALNPVDYNIFNLGSIYESKGDLNNARKYYYRSLNALGTSLSKTNHTIDMYLAIAEFSAIRDTSPNLDVIMKGLKDFPDDPSLWMFLAIAHYRLGNIQKSQSAINKAYNLSQAKNILYVKQQIDKRLPILIKTKNDSREKMISPL